MKKIVIFAAAALFFIVLAGLLNQRPHRSRGEQIAEGCAKEFSSEGEERINQCRIAIMMRERAEQENAKMARAAR